jgi:hypothetical protein
MKIQEMRELKPGGFAPGPQAGHLSRRRAEGMGLRVALLGAACVAGVFALLGLLYTFG